MRLEIESIDIQNIEVADRTIVEDHILYLNLNELKELLLKDNRIKDVDLNIVYPGDRVRIINLMDVIQPRCKTDPEGTDFPGFLNEIKTAGRGKTRSLRGVAVLVSNPETHRKYSAFLDMAGRAAELSLYGKMKNVCVSPSMADGVNERDFEAAVKQAGLKTAVYLARASKKHAVDDTELFQLEIAKNARKSGLPTVVYYYQLYSPQHDHRGISDPCFYGTDVRNLLPTIIHPNEVLDGGIIGHDTIRSLDTYSIQNHAIIKELYRRNGKDLIFGGVVCGVANLDPLQRQRKAIMASNLISEILGAHGVILTKIHGGLPHVDLAFVAEECEKLGVKTVLFVQPLVSEGALSETSLFNSEYLDAIVVPGATQERILVSLEADKFIGGNGDTSLFTPDPFIQKASAEIIDTEEFLIAGIHDHLGGRNIIAVEY
jgi:glycine reductase